MIAGAGAVTAIGLCSAQTATSARAGISRIRETDIETKTANPLRAGFLHDEHLEQPHPRLRDIERGSTPERLLQLAGPALRESYEALGDEGDPPAVVLGLAGPHQLPSGGADVLLENLSRQAQVRLNLQESRVVMAGRAGGLAAVGEAIRTLAAPGAPPLIAGGVDSYLDERLADLDLDDRLLDEGVPDGFLPGEGAGFVTLARPGDRSVAAKPLATLNGMSEGFEKGHLASSEPMRGDGLAKTLRALFQAVPPSLLPCNAVLANLNGESFGAKQWGIAYIRNRRYFSEGLEIFHPAEYFGDAGAAMGPILIGMAAQWLSRGKSRTPFLVWCAADEGPCTAAFVAPQT